MYSDCLFTIPFTYIEDHKSELSNRMGQAAECLLNVIPSCGSIEPDIAYYKSALLTPSQLQLNSPRKWWIVEWIWPRYGPVMALIWCRSCRPQIWGKIVPKRAAVAVRSATAEDSCLSQSII